MESNWADSLREKLDEHYVWPSLYTFKFIVPKEKVAEVKKLFPRHESTERSSKNGNYISVTVQMMMPGSDEVIEVYNLASGVEGLIAL
jgi:putative lipoic acid-binding regulatory protein